MLCRRDKIKARMDMEGQNEVNPKVWTDLEKCHKGGKTVTTLFNKPILSYKIHPFFV